MKSKIHLQKIEDYSFDHVEQFVRDSLEVLDPEASIEIVKIFERLSELGITIVMSTHNHSLIQNTKHTIINLHLGSRVLS